MALATSLCRWFKQACAGRRSHFSDLIERQRGVNDNEAVRFLASELTEALPDALLELEGLAAGSIGLSRRAGQTYFRRDVQQERQVRLQATSRRVRLESGANR